MKTQTLLRLRPAALALPLAACAPDVEDVDGLVYRDTTIGCGDQCGTNHSEVNSYQIADINLDGVPNSAGVVLLGALSPGDVSFPLEVVDDEFAVDDGSHWHSGADLIGWKLQLVVASEVMEVEIMNHSRDASGPTAISTYALAYLPDEGAFSPVNVCPEVLNDPMATVLTLIGGELYDRDAVTVVTPDEPRWVTLACAEEATYKMKRLGYGPNDFSRGQPAAQWQRQATLKMITADYCGIGHSFTVPGTKLHWRNESGSVDTSLETLCPNVEAAWTEDGALCLSNPRLGAVTAAAVNAVCPQPIPLCTPALLGPHEGEYEWMTWRHDGAHE